MNADETLEPLLEYLRDKRGFDFTGYKRTTLSRRIRKRMDAVGAESIDAYLDLLQVDPHELTLLFNHILINVTAFFRDPDVWDFLAEEVVPAIVGNRPDGPIRVWVPGCASGEEAYGLAMLFAEQLGLEAFRGRVKVYGTDLDDDALGQARQAIYSAKQVSDVPPAFLQRYFEESGVAYAVTKELRSAVVFGRHDIVSDAPISKVDLLSCRNTLMYLNSETQAKVLAHFYFSLNEMGYLVLGRAETLFAHVQSFVPVDRRRRIFAKKHVEGDARDRLMLLTAAGMDPAVGRISNHVRGREAAFEFGPLPQLVVDRDGLLVQANDRARELFGLHQVNLGRPFSDLEVSFRPAELRSVLERVQRQRAPVTLKDVRWQAGEATAPRFYDVELVPLIDAAGRLLGVSIAFADTTRFVTMQRELEQSNQELETALEELQSTNEELETTNEELQSTNEELETTNEELQSTNEELETMNEELQSTNEELHTINEQARQRSDELIEVNAFMSAMLSSLDAAIVVLDPELRVDVWNSNAQQLWGLRADEVMGQPFLGLDIGLPVGQLRGPILAALSDERPAEVKVDAVNRRGQAIVCRVRCLPLRGPDDAVVRGVVVTMENGVLG